MPSSYRTPSVGVTPRPPQDTDVDLLVVPVFEDDDLADVPWLEAATGGDVARARERGDFKGKAFDVFVTFLGVGRRAILVGAGNRRNVTADRLRRVAITGCLQARGRRLRSVGLASRAGTGIAEADAAQAMAEGAVLANFDGGSYKTDEPRVFLESVQLCLAGDGEAVSANQAAEHQG